MIPIIRAAGKPKVHLITYAAPVTKNMLHFSGLSYYVLPRLPVGYTVPDWLSIELGLFAGRLYLNFSECAPLIQYLQLADKTNIEAVGLSTNNPLAFLLDWLTVCRKGQDIMHTPMGYICQGRPLHENHPFFVARSVDARDVRKALLGGGNSGNADEAEEGDLDVEDEWGESFQQDLDIE